MFDCVVVGAGFAGLAAAAELAERGKNVVVLEARDRVGGRVASIYQDGQLIEIGGQWVSPGNEAMHELIDEANLETVGPTEGTVLIRSQGTVFKSTQAPDRAHALSPFEMADLGQGVLRFRRLAERIDSDPTWAAANAAWLGQSVGRWVKTNLRTPTAQQDFAAVLAEVAAKDADELTLGEALKLSIAGTDLESLFTVSGGLKLRRIRGGMHLLAETLADRLGDRIRLAEIVTGYEYDLDSVTVHTESGESYQAHRVINTLPPWLALKQQYEPALPAWRYEAVERTQPGHNIKAFAVYDEPWWRDQGLSGQMSADEGPVRVSFDITDPGGPGVLFGLFEGNEAAAMSKFSTSMRERAFIDSLATVFGEGARSAHVYVDYDWGADPYTRGCHTPHFSPGAWTATGQVLAEAAGPIRFAGSEYASKYNGYLEGAVRSGREEARAILRELA